MRLLQILLFLTISLSPLYIFRGITLVPIINFYIPYTILEVMIIISTVSTLIYSTYKRETLAAFRTRFDLLILLFLISAFISIFYSFDPIGGLGIFKAYFLEPVLFYYCLTYVAKRTRPEFIYFGAMAAAFWLCIHALVQKFTGSFTFVPIELSQGRVTAVYNSANALAMFLGPICLLSIGRFLKSSYWKKVFYFSLALLILAVIYQTRSRGGIVAITLSLGILGFILLTLKSKFLQKTWFLMPVLILCGLGIFIYQLYLTYNFFPIDWGKPYTKGDTLQIRYFLWAGTVNLLKENTVTGSGLNGFKTLYTNQYRLPQYQEEFQYPHNLFLTFWTETGIYGLTSFLLIVVSGLGLIIRKIRKSDQAVYGACFIAILSYWLFHGVVDVPYFKNDLSLEFWLVIALIESWA